MESATYGRIPMPKHEELCLLCNRQPVERRPLCAACNQRVKNSASRAFMSTVGITAAWLLLVHAAARYFEFVFYPTLIGAAFVWFNGVLLVAKQIERRTPPLLGNVVSDNCTFGMVLTMALWVIIELVIAVTT